MDEKHEGRLMALTAAVAWLLRMYLDKAEDSPEELKHFADALQAEIHSATRHGVASAVTSEANTTLIDLLRMARP